VYLGAHCSGGIKKSLDRAAEIGADSLQLFVQSPRAWKFPDHDPKDLAAFRTKREELGIGGVVVHALYLVNLASPNDEFYEKSIATMSSTMDASSAIGAEAVIFPVGSHQGAGFEAGLERVVPAMEQILEHSSETTWLLMENSAGAGGDDRPLARRARRAVRRVLEARAARRLPRLVPPLGVRLRR